VRRWWCLRDCTGACSWTASLVVLRLRPCGAPVQQIARGLWIGFFWGGTNPCRLARHRRCRPRVVPFHFPLCVGGNLGPFGLGSVTFLLEGVGWDLMIRGREHDGASREGAAVAGHLLLVEPPMYPFCSFFFGRVFAGAPSCFSFRDSCGCIM
jgi:hypothetical protein